VFDALLRRATLGCWIAALALTQTATAAEHRPASPPAADTPWTLPASVRRAVDTAPELRGAQAEVEVRAGELGQARAWPNPSVSARADDKLGLEDNAGGYDLTEIALSQPLPLTRRPHQRRVATARVDAAQALRRYEALVLEHQTAQAYHDLQLASAKLELAHERLAQAQGYLQRKRDPLVRYLTRAERLRLEVVREAAEQAAASAEGEYSEALSHFKARLALAAEAQPLTAPLKPASPPPPLAALTQRLDDHPALIAAREERNAAQAGVGVARAQRLADPVISVYRQRDFIGGSRQDVTGIGLSVQVPLWSRGGGAIASANAQTHKATAQLQARERDLASELRLSHTHLQHLIEQAQRYEDKLLAPTERMLALARKSFAVGQADILALVDAHNSHFEARERYLTLLHAAQQEAAALRLAAGRSVLEAGAMP
jgi:cobalt-zinc-cadmium efflux system outer membrane protein